MKNQRAQSDLIGSYLFHPCNPWSKRFVDLVAVMPRQLLRGHPPIDAVAQISPAALIRAIRFVVLKPGRKGRNRISAPTLSNAARSSAFSFSKV